ncbi:MAG TPA: CAP domain-containing protein [Candidatus Limnocylindrales bacterium]|nr:CAP domain-containing protein [Candidatus Limnocylindrales bacterium]
MPSLLAPRRILSPFALAAVLAVGVAGPAQVVASDPAPSASAISAAESAMVVALNKDRTAVGLVPVRVDPRLMAIARARSADMVANNYFSHTQPDGRNVFDILTAQGITWYSAGEIIAWNTWGMDGTTNAANQQWMGSSSHKAIIVSTGFNYVGVGLAVDATGKKLWTAVFMKGPDRTGARAAQAAPKLSAGPTADTRHARITWTGADVRLQVLTAGLRSFIVERRIDGVVWKTIWSSTTITAATFTVNLGHRYEFRVTAVDNRGNRGAGVITVVDLR